MKKEAYQWQKNGLVFGPQQAEGRDWFKEFAQAPCSLEYGDFLRVFFSCRPAPDENRQYVSRSSYADFSYDKNFSLLRVADKPFLPLGGKGEFDEFGTYPVSVIRHQGKVFAYYAGWTRCVSVPFDVAIGLAISEDDGHTFTRVGHGPVLSSSLDEPFIISGPKIRYYNNLFHLFYIAGKEWILDNNRPEPIYRIRMATSTDGYHWQKANRDLIDVKLGTEEAQSSPDVFYSNGLYHMFFSYRGGRDYRGKEHGYRIGYAWSEDLHHWHRDDERAGLDVSAEGWDSEMVSYPHIFRFLGSIRMLYLGNQVGRQGFGMATLLGEL